MKISATTYVRNGFTLTYPFLEAIRSVLPIVDEFIAVVGDSTDGTREAIAAIGDNKIKIVDTVWDDTLRSRGLIFAQQANIGLDHVSEDADWIFHIQADELIHENDYPAIQEALLTYKDNKSVDGLLFKFYNFYGDYQHYAPSRRFHQHEIRIIKNNKKIRSYRDSQGFRIFNHPEKAHQEKGTKLKVKLINASIYHYSWVRPPKKQKEKHIEFGKRYHTDDVFIEKYTAIYGDAYDYRDYDYLKVFAGTHPALMQSWIAAQDWQFTYIPEKNNMNLKEKFMKLLEDITGKQFFIYKNYILV
jgi:glycosyltransferase involved in cell wall biosynthesis